MHFSAPLVAPKTQRKQILRSRSADRAGTRGGKQHLGAPVFHEGDLDPRFFATVHRSCRRLGPPCRDVDQSRRCHADLIATARAAAPRWGRGSEMGGHCVVGDRCLLRELQLLSFTGSRPMERGSLRADGVSQAFRAANLGREGALPQTLPVDL